MWGANIDAIADAGYTVYALDEAGFGRTDNPRDFSIETRTAHVQGFLAAMGLERYTLWGHSDGSYIGCAIALQDPRVERLVLMASGSLSPHPPNEDKEAAAAAAAFRDSYTPSIENARSTLLHSLVNKAAVTEELVRDFYEASTGKNVAAYQGRIEARKRPIYDELKALRIPTLLLWGADDSGGALRGLLLFEKIPHAELHVFSDCAHWVQRDQTDRVHSLVLDFLRGR
jgi:pimeloyl-ACP methyl ester carboxylesterase